ncbi:MAG: hypothetical protein H6581_24895 [Bacteroidia bacterium]|nr:hypothetical protein [Bacteroidia bacterium]
MATELYVEPGADIHLARSTAGANQVVLKVFSKTLVHGPRQEAEQRDFDLQDVTGNVRFDVHVPTGMTQSIAINTVGGVTTLSVSGGTGKQTNYIHIMWQETPASVNYMYYLIKVTVHNTIDGWWFGNNRLSVPKHSLFAHCQVSIFAACDRASSIHQRSIVDITGHGFVNLGLGAGAGDHIALDGDGRGKITGNTLTAGNSTVDVTGSWLGLNGTVPVRVIDFYGGQENIGGNQVRVNRSFPVQRHAGTGSSGSKCNLLILGEGFSTQADFDRAIEQITGRMFSSRRHSPFLWLKDDFIIWKNLIPSEADGISIATTVYEGNVSGPDLPGHNGIWQTRDSGLGMSLGSWNSVQNSLNALVSSLSGGAPTAQQITDRVNARRQARSIASLPEGDDRRYPAEMLFKNAIMRYVKSLVDTSVPDNDPDFTIGNKWQNDPLNFKKDYGFVCLLVNDVNFRAANSGSYFTTNVDARSVYAAERAAEHPLHHPSAHVWKITRNYTAQMEPEEVTDTFVHEFGHSFELGDEYEEFPGAYGGTQIGFDNLSSIDVVRQGAAPANPAAVVESIDPSKLKWASLHRVKKSDRIAADVTIPQNATSITVTLSGEEWRVRRWELNNNPNNSAFILNFSHANFSHLQFPIDGTSPVRLENLILAPGGVNAAMKTVTFNLPAPAAAAITIKAGSLLYEPVRDCDHHPQTLIDPHVLDFMNRTQEPLSHNKDLANPANSCLDVRVAGRPPADNPPQALITELQNARAAVPNHHFLILGAYEGAANSSCGVFRPSGACKMRDHNVPDAEGFWQGAGESEFCFVCQYIIVNRVNPEKHEVIDYQTYPAMFTFDNCGAPA